MVPHPCLRIDGLSNRTEEPDTAEIMFLHPFLPLPHDRPDGCRSSIENRYFVFFRHFPETVRFGIVGYPLEHQACCAGSEWTVYKVTMASHPSDICRAPEYIFLPVVENPLKGLLYIQEISRRAMDDPLRFSCTSTGIKNE